MEQTIDYTYETGTIRPPSEAGSLLIRATRNCPWNKCGFCITYKDSKFSRRNAGDVKNDIDNMRAIALRIIDASHRLGFNGDINDRVIRLAAEDDRAATTCYRQVAAWLDCGSYAAFIQDADSLILPAGEIVEILDHLNLAFPTLHRITTYARSKTILRKSYDELIKLYHAGLTRLHVGLESGSDNVLTAAIKGTTSSEHIEAGLAAKETGYELSLYFMPGLGGKDLSVENALKSADVVNQINPQFIRIRTTVPLPGTPIHDAMKKGTWQPLGEDDKIREIRLFIENLRDVSSVIQSDHMMNLLEDLQGSLPVDRDRLLDLLDCYLTMPEEDREKFIIGRRLGYFRSLSDYNDDSGIVSLWRDFHKRYGSIDKAVQDIVRHFI